jgi:hypothetical protein
VNLTATCCNPPGAIVPFVQFSVYPSGLVIPVTESVPVPLLPIVSVRSDVFPISTAPKARLPVSDTTLVFAGGGVGVGALGLFFPQAEAARARRSTTRQIERMSGHPSSEAWIAIVMPRALNSLM